VVWVHGGGWVTGDRARLNAKRAWAQANGWTLVSVNYRLTRLSDPPGERVRYPTHDRDVGRALDWVEDHLGAGPIALLGHSAGAQIVSSIGTDERYTRADLCGVVSLDTEGYDVAARIASGDRGARLYRAVFGNRPAVWRDASPIHHVDADDPPELVVRRGTLHRQQGQAAFARALRKAGVRTTVVPTPAYSHSDVNRLLGDRSDDVLTPRVEAFLDDCFAA
jgi:acetyl esterase/lipase